MKNKEKYKKNFSEYDICDKDSPWHAVVCHGKNCKGCIERFIKWSEQEALPCPTGIEAEVLRAIDSEFKYIARDECGKLFVYIRKPEKAVSVWTSTPHCKSLPLSSLFDWVRFEDAEPWCIDDIVKRNEK